nr:succinate dehydrogenase cytochrome b subunit [uncultured Holophaga sp.]
MSVAEQTLGNPARASFATSSVGRKILMAVTGLVLSIFVTVHMIGNIQAYLGASAMNAYAHFLQHSLHGGGIWIARLVLLLVAVVHVWSAASLTLTNWSARPQGYRAQQLQSASWASRSMRYTGVLLALFIIYHILHLTTGQAHPDFVPGDAYGNFVKGFRSPVACTIYVLAQICLALHIWHGLWSLTQTFGWSHPRYETLRRTVSGAVALVVALVNISFPIAVQLGVIR